MKDRKMQETRARCESCEHFDCDQNENDDWQFCEEKEEYVPPWNACTKWLKRKNV